MFDGRPITVPAVAGYGRGDVRVCLLTELRWQLEQPDDWRQWNLGGNQARAILSTTPGVPHACI